MPQPEVVSVVSGMQGCTTRTPKEKQKNLILLHKINLKTQSNVTFMTLSQVKIQAYIYQKFLYQVI